MDKTSIQLHSYSPTPVFDSHTHIQYIYPIDMSLENFKNIMRHFNYEKIHIAALGMNEPTDNYRALYCKDNIQGAYVSGSVNHRYDARDTAEYYLSEIKKYWAMGCDGMKLLELKPSTHRTLGHARLDDKKWDKFFGYAEENRIPLTLHCGDPLRFWDAEKAGEWAVSHGWVSGPDEPTLEELRSEVSGILQKFPGLIVTLAHFYFMGAELDRAAKLFDTYPGVTFDITPGGEMFYEMSEDIDSARLFFKKYSKRILYGTDTYPFPLDGMSEEERYGRRINFARTFLEGKEDFLQPDRDDVMLHPLSADSDVLEDVYRGNFLRRFGEKPRELDYERIAMHCRLDCAEQSASYGDYALRNYLCTAANKEKTAELMKQNMNHIAAYFENK